MFDSNLNFIIRSMHGLNKQIIFIHDTFLTYSFENVIETKIS